MFVYTVMLATYSKNHKHQRRASKRILEELHKFPEIQNRNRYLFLLAQGYMTYQTQKKIDENVMGFINNYMIPSPLMVCVMGIKKHTTEDPLFGPNQIRHHRFLQGITDTVYRLYKHQD